MCTKIHDDHLSSFPVNKQSYIHIYNINRDYKIELGEYPEDCKEKNLILFLQSCGQFTQFFKVALRQHNVGLQFRYSKVIYALFIITVYILIFGT